MSVSIVRPDVAELAYYVFARNLHPELFTICAQTEFRQENYIANVQICDAGHVLTITTRDQVLCEVTTSRESPLPQRKRLFYQRLRGNREESLEFDSGLEYHTSFNIEQLDPETFLHFHEELFADSRQSSLSHHFPAPNRWSPTPMSFLQVESQPQSLLVHAFHTFPDNNAVVKTQSLLEF